MTPLDLPLINGDKTILAAIYMQNKLQSNNNLRREAITAGKYVEINTSSIANDYLAETLHSLIKNKVNVGTKTLISEAQGKMAN